MICWKPPRFDVHYLTVALTDPCFGIRACPAAIQILLESGEMNSFVVNVNIYNYVQMRSAKPKASVCFFVNKYKQILTSKQIPCFGFAGQYDLCMYSMFSLTSTTKIYIQVHNNTVIFKRT